MTSASPARVMPADRRATDRGSASICVLFVGMIISLFGVASAAIGSATTARHQAQVAADLGALAGAARAIWGAGEACGRASAYVAANGALLTECTVDGLDLLVTASVRWHGWSAEATARAGPG